jgi:hypothetical protein
MIQGEADGTVLPQSTEAKDQYFTEGYRRLLLEGAGHFPTREAPAAVANLGAPVMTMRAIGSHRRVAS